MTLYILKYNNYYNRLVKSETTLDEYVSNLIYPETDIGVIQAVNFNPNDGVNTQHVIGVGDYDGSGDYLLAVDENDDIVSRWFIIDTVRTRAGQYQLSLRRDLVVDYYNVIVQSPMFIEKATLPYSSPLLFNEENFAVNQIKQKETLLKDKSDIPWIVGYYSKGSTLQGTVNINEEVDSIPLNISKIEDWEYYQYKQRELIGPASYGAYMFKYVDGPVLSPVYFKAEVNADNGNTNRTQLITQSVQLQHVGTLLSESRFKEAFTSYGLSRLNPSAYSGAETNSKVLDLNSYSGSVVKTLDGKYHQISVNSIQRTNTINISSGELFNQLADIVSSNLGMIGTPNTSTFTYKFTAQYYSVTIQELTNLETKYNITNNKLVTTDAPWDIFAIPFGAIKVTMEDNTTLQTNADIGIAAAMAIQAQQSGKVYDIQILPYLPMQELLTTSGFNEIRLTDPRQYSKILDKDNATVGIILNANKSRFNFKISFNIGDPKFKVAQSNIEKKVRNECDKWRLTSPNYSNYFDFSVQKNGGISYFDIDCEYKPFTPYVHLNPNFSYLYGYDDNSPRGLVLGGDFSISQIIDQWQQYQIQNKNFQNIFDRQIQNMEVTNKYQRKMDIVGAITGTVQGALSGAFLGSAMSGGTGISKAAGGIGGTVASGIAGIADVMIKDKLRNEAMDYTKDLFGYQLGNIQALPNTISKVSALNNNNKIFPILEYYTCTEEEEKAFINKVAYNGMTVMVIGTFQDYLGNSWEYKNITDKGYIKGQLIKFNDDGEDFHVVNEIAAELNKGVYIKQ